MRIHWVKLVAGAAAAEIGAVVILILVVAIFGPNNLADAQVFAERVGRWVGPSAGMALSFLGSFWIARTVASGAVAHGVLFGICISIIDLALLVAMQTPFEWLLVFSNIGKLLTATAGGALASRLRIGTSA